MKTREPAPWAVNAGEDRIAAMWFDENLTMKQIAEKLGAPSRSAVAGWIHKYKMRKQAAEASAPPTPPKLTVVQRKPQKTPRLLSLFELGDGVCRYPLGDKNEPATVFCGADVLQDMPYCKAHCDVCYQASAALRARKLAAA